MFLKNYVFAFCFIVWSLGEYFIFPSESFAQIKLPKSVEPTRIRNRFKSFPVEELEQTKFLLSGILIEGATIYKNSDFMLLYK